MIQFTTLEYLVQARTDRKAVYVPGSYTWGKPKPAAFMLNQPGDVLVRLLRAGMFIYEKEGE